MWQECHVARKSVKVPAEALGCSLASGRSGLSELSNDEHPTRNAFTGAGRILHHIRWVYFLGFFQRLTEAESVLTTDV